MITRAVELDEDMELRRPPARVPITDMLDELTKVVRAVYCNAVRLTGIQRYARYGQQSNAELAGDKVIKSGPNRGRTGWAVLASKMVELKAPIDLYIRAQFHTFNRTNHLANEKPFPPVTMLYSNWAEENWRAYARDRPQAITWQMQSDQVQLRLNIQPIVVQLHWSQLEATEYALRDHFGCVITPLTRYCTACKHGIDSVSRESFRGALFQYIFEATYYDDILGSDIPELLREEARRIRRNMGL